MPVGSELKAARKKAGISLDVIAKRTKVRVDKLVALEKADFKNLPAGFYLFSLVRAYAHEVHLDPEPIVAGLRAEFAEKDALDALHALDATGALNARMLANAGRSKEERSTFYKNAAVAIGLVLMAGGGAGAGVYLYRMRAVVLPEVGSTSIVRVSRPPTLNLAETSLVPLFTAPQASTSAEATDPPRQAAGEIRETSSKTSPSKGRTSARKQRPQETVESSNAVADASSSATSEGNGPREEPAPAP